MLGELLSGQTLVWQPILDPPGAWGLILDGDVVVECGWSRNERAVRVEIDSDVWLLHAEGTFEVRAVLVPGREQKPTLIYAGGTRRGLALCEDGAGFALTYGFEMAGRPRYRTSSSCFQDPAGRTVLRAKEGRADQTRLAWRTSVSLAEESRYQAYLCRLLALWGGLKVLSRRRPLLTACSAFTSEASAQRGLAEMEASVFG